MSVQERSIHRLRANQGRRTRQRLLVKGVVQGVGFRPFAYRLANELGLSGWVRNTPVGVQIEVEGSSWAVSTFRRRLGEERPPNAAIESIASALIDPDAQLGFTIRDSSNDPRLVCSIPPDLSTCDHCLREVFDPDDRRFGYPFTNCTECGPRWSIITDLPYDRPHTTMSGFEMCPACRAEYNDPSNRRFHAQPNACPDCGPQLALMTMAGQVVSRQQDVLTEACQAIRDGKIVAVKGIGGFHLMADARHEAAIKTLRERKHRPAKPFAVMLPSLDETRALCEVSELERRALCSPQSPIILLRKRAGIADLAQGVAPNNPYLGVMLAYTPLHHLMLRLLRFPVVATSGNLSGEPICIDDHQAMQRLGAIADFMLTHDRPIARPVDDSIVQIIDNEPRVLRRSRGYAPLAIKLPMRQTTGPILAVGAQQKAAVGLAVNSEALLSQHIGDLASVEAVTALHNTTADLQNLLRVKPRSVAADLHPDYHSTQAAQQLGLPVSSVQHHAAHVYAAMAEHDIGPMTTVLGAAWDGTGLGTDGTAWGGELLKVCGTQVERVGHLEPFLLPGSDAASRQPWRSALGVLFEVFGSAAFEMDDLPPIARIPDSDKPILMKMFKTRTNSPTTTSMGRLFDAVASLLGMHQLCTFEGEAAMGLQFAAESIRSLVPSLRIEIDGSGPCGLDWRPAIREIVVRIRQGKPASSIARAFHFALAEGLTEWITTVAKPPFPNVLLTGGCFQNKLLAEMCMTALRNKGIEPYLHRRVPPNDGGLVLGQLYAAALHSKHDQEELC